MVVLVFFEGTLGVGVPLSVTFSLVMVVFIVMVSSLVMVVFLATMAFLGRTLGAAVLLGLLG